MVVFSGNLDTAHNFYLFNSLDQRKNDATDFLKFFSFRHIFFWGRKSASAFSLIHTGGLAEILTLDVLPNTTLCLRPGWGPAQGDLSSLVVS